MLSVYAAAGKKWLLQWNKIPSSDQGIVDKGSNS